MSHPFYNPYVPGNQSSTQGSYGLPSMQAERNPGTGSPHFGPGSSSSAASSVPPGGMIPSLLTQSVNYRPEQSRAKIDKDIERSVDLHISRAREEVTFVGKPDHRPMSQSTRFTNTQEILSSGTGTTSYLMSTTSASAGRRHSDVESGSGSSDWLPCYKRSTADDSSKFYSPPASTNYTSSERERDVPATPGLGDFDYRVSDKPGAPTETSRPKYNSEAATDILLQFGLEKKDLDYLIAYPEDQMTPDNLPFILRQIRTQKTERAERTERTVIPPKPYPQPQPIRGVSGMEGFRGSGGSSAVLQPTKVIDYGHTGNYAGGALDEIGRTSGGSGNMLLVNTNNISSHTPEPPQKDTAEVKSSALGSSFGQGGAVSNSSYNSILRSAVTQCIDPAQRLKTQPNQTYQSIHSSSSLSRKDKDGGFRHEESSKARPLKKTHADHKSAAKTQPSSSLFRSVHPNRPGLVVIGTSEATGTKNQSATQGKGSTVAKQMEKQQTQQQPMQMPKKQVPKQPVTQMGKALWPPVVSATQPSSLLSIPTYPSRTVQPSGFSPHSTSTPSASLQPARSLKNFLQSPTQHPAKLPDTKTLPTPAMMHDYAAATPGVFPHTCSLCFKEFTNMKDWISHQNTSLHLESCRVLRTKYPQWNGEIVLEPSAARKDAKPSSSASAQTSQQRHKKTSHGGRSRSHSEGRREKRSRSLSSHSSRYTRSRTRSRSPRYDHDWSHSRSHERQRRRDDRWSSPTRSLERRSSLPRRSEERWSSPRRSRERLPSPRRRDERWSSPGWSEERWSSPRRSPERLSSPRRDDERWLSPKRRDDLWYSRRPSSSESSPQRRLSSASRLSKKQFGKSDVQSLSTLVKTLTPALLNELAKKTKGGKRLNLYPSAVRKSPCSAAPPSVKKKTMVKSDVSASPKTKLFKPSPPTMVRLEGVVNSLSHGDVVAAMEQFGKTKSVVLFRKKLEALVCFEKEEDAKKLKSLKSIDLKGIVVYVVTQKNLQLKKAPLKKPVLSGVSTSQTAKTTKTTTSSRTVLLPTPCKVSQNSSGAKTKQIQQAPASASIAVSNDFAVSQELLTIGDMIIKHLNQNKIKCIRKKTCQLTQFLDCGKKHMVISHLPKYEDGCYTEEDIANVLIPYGFIYKHENIFVFPEACMAFVVMPTVQEAHEIMKLTVSDSIMFKGSRLLPHVIHDNVLKSPLMFYRYLMSLFLMRSNEDRGERIIYIKNISPSEARDLRETLRTIDSVINYLPLLNKVYVEFDSSRDADRIGVWHSLLKHAPGYKVYRLKTTDGLSTALSPKLAANALPDGKDVVPGATIPSVKFGVPQGSIAPFWVTMATGPFVFPTVSPWFIIPEHLTVKGDVDIEKANSRSTMFPTLMLTGLPEGGYRQEDVARLVWPYFPKQTLHSLYYNVIVLTLQRRAFVHFSDWKSCCDFVRDHIRKPVSVRGCVLKIHFVLEYMYPESKEELMYKSLMKWSNSRVPDPQSLEERLLCVEISETRVELVKTVMKMVASIAKFVSFLPLANRICVEMADSSGVTKVVEKYNSYLLTSISASQGQNRCRVQGVESVKSLKQRLEDCTEIILNLGLDAISAEAPPATQPPPPKPSDNGQQPVVQTSVRASAKPAACDESITCEHGEKLGTEIALDSTACPQSNEEQLVKMVEDGSPTTTDDAASGATHTHLVTSEEPTTELLQIDQEPFGAKEGQEDFSDDVLASDAYIFDEPDFDMSDFVTVDEISDDVEETSPDLHSSSSSKQSSTGKKVKQSSGTSYAPKQTSNRSSTRSSTRFLKDSKSSASFSSKSTKDYVRRSSSSISTSVSPKTTKDSSKSIKSPASSYASSSFLSLETSPSSCHKAQRSKTKSPLKGSHASSSSCGIRLSSTARERVKMLSAAVSVERLPVSQRQAAKESVVAKSDHKVSAEGIAAKTVESETKIEKSSEMHPPAQGQRFGLSQDQNVETGLKDTALKDPEKGKEKKEEEEEEEDDDDGGEKYQRLDSFDGRTDKQQDEGNQAGSSDTKSPEPEKCLVLDSVNDDGKDDTEEEKVSEMVDSIEEELVQEAAATERTDRRRSGRGKKEDKMTLNLTEASEKADEDEEASYEILDSVEDETATEEPAVMTRSTRGRRGRTTKKDQTKKEDTPTRRRRTPARESQEKTPKMEKEASSKGNSPTKKSDITVREEIDEDATYEILDSVEDEVLKDDRPSTGGKRKRGRPKKEVKSTRKDTVTLKGDKEASEKADEDEEASYEILDSVEDETATEEPAVMTRSTRGRRGRTTKKDQTKKEDTPTRRRRTPARESQEKTPKGNSPTRKSDITVREEIDEDATYEILDSVEDEVLKDDRPPTGGKRKRGRPKKEVRTTRKDTVTLKGDKEADDEEKVSYQILDSVEDEMVEDHPPTEESHKNEEEEPLYQIVDSVEDDQVQEELTTEETKDETCPKEEEAAVKEDTPTCSTIVEASEKVVTKDLDHEGTSTTKVKDPTTPEVEKNQVRSALVNLDEVSDEEEDYPDDIAEEEELRERMAAAKEKQLTMKEERRTREKEEEEEVDTKELVTLDEVGADEAGEEVALQGGESDAETTAGELGGLVTLDEIVEEDEEEEGKGEQRLLEPRPPSKDEESLDSLNPKYLVTLDEAGEDEEEKVDEAEETSTSAKRKYDDDTEENVNFVTVDEVGEVEEEEEEEHKAPRTRGRAKKRTRKTPVRKSARGRKVDEREEQESGSCVPPPTSLEASSSLDKDPSALSTDGQQEIQKEEEEGANPPDIEAASAGEDLQPESLEAEEEKEGWSSADVKVVSKRKKEIVGPEAKRSRSQSPSVPADFELPPFRANQPLGQEFVVPKSGYFCNICRVFYLSESSAKDVHCSSQAHYNNLQAHYRKLQQNLSGSSTPNSQGFISD
ncbi:zinc finger protein 638-like isoform X3 [Hippoglossus hippoglossus]|uniref:zinc finger protein 638-like isoform X3 n=1 Tax=Hippoglossus hippoglossus TaxID=8267 RepID=UPI00148D4E65|nr:zinc finger protein 638-like isoform X3 [Hippoglossus hippoglossus]